MTETAFGSPRAINIVAGYLAAVATAAIVVAAIMTMDGPDRGMFLSVVMIGGIYIGVTGVPGFALTVFLARRHGWSGWLPFAITGGLNALLAWYLMHGLRLNGIDPGLLLACVRGGVAGGMAYWWTTYHGLQRTPVGRAAKLG